MIVLTLIFLKVSKEIMVKKKSLTPKLEVVHPPNFIFPIGYVFQLTRFSLTRKRVSTIFSRMWGPGCMYVSIYRYTGVS